MRNPKEIRSPNEKVHPDSNTIFGLQNSGVWSPGFSRWSVESASRSQILHDFAKERALPAEAGTPYPRRSFHCFLTGRWRCPDGARPNDKSQTNGMLRISFGFRHSSFGF